MTYWSPVQRSRGRTSVAGEFARKRFDNFAFGSDGRRRATSDEWLLASARCGARRRCRYYDDNYGDGQRRAGDRNARPERIKYDAVESATTRGVTWPTESPRNEKESLFAPDAAHKPQSSSDSFPRHRKSSTARSDELRHVSDFLSSDRHRVHILHLPVTTSQLVVGQRIFSFHQFYRHNVHIHRLCVTIN
jgi:hypothetical protein